MGNIAKSVKYAALVLVLFAIRLIIHEAGHIITALIFKAKITNIIIMPGIRLYPELAWLHWEGMGAAIDYKLENGTPFQSGLIALMGSGLSSIIGYLIILFLLIKKVTRGTKIMLLLLTLICCWDIIAYSIFPEIGLKHWIIMGGRVPEPLIGAIYLGLNYAQYQLLFIFHVLLSNGLILYFLVKLRRQAVA